MFKFIRFKRFFLKRHFKKVLLEKGNNRVVSQKEIKTVGIITTEEISNWVNVKEEVEKLLNVRNVKIYSFRPSATLNPKIKSKYNVTSEKKNSFW